MYLFYSDIRLKDWRQSEGRLGERRLKKGDTNMVEWIYFSFNIFIVIRISWTGLSFVSVCTAAI
jgi:hypothetical protein